MKNEKLIQILLPTEDATGLIWETEITKELTTHILGSGCENFHLHLCSNAPIKEGENVLYNLGSQDTPLWIVGKWSKGYLCHDKRKIELTTDPKLIADGVKAIDWNTKAYILANPGAPAFEYEEVNFLSEFCKRYNEKDNQKVDVEKLACDITCGEAECRGFIEGYNQALQDKMFSLEDARRIFKAGEAWGVTYSTWFTPTEDDSDNQFKGVIQSLTKSEPKGDIVIECEMEEELDEFETQPIFTGNYRIKLKNGQPILTFR